MDKDDMQKRPVPLPIVLRHFFNVRVIRWNNERIGQLNGWTLTLSFGLGSIAIKSNAHCFQVNGLATGFDFYFWPNAIRFSEGDFLFRYHWHIEDRVYV